LEKEEALLLAELAGKDYKVVKAAETSQSLSILDPDLHARREYCRGRINEICIRLDELNGLLS
jgi:hypothetical protein